MLVFFDSVFKNYWFILVQWCIQIIFDYVYGVFIDVVIFGVCYSFLFCVIIFSKIDIINGLYIECLWNVFILSCLGNDRYGFFNIYVCLQ